MSSKETASTVLRKASVPLVKTDACNAPGAYDGASKDGRMSAGPKEGSRSPAQRSALDARPGHIGTNGECPCHLELMLGVEGATDRNLR